MLRKFVMHLYEYNTFAMHTRSPPTMRPGWLAAGGQHRSSPSSGPQTSTLKRRNSTQAAMADGLSWVRKVAGDAVADAVLRESLDWATLLELDTYGWKELGATAVQAAKLKAMLKRLDLTEDVLFSPDSSDGQGEAGDPGKTATTKIAAEHAISTEQQGTKPPKTKQLQFKDGSSSLVSYVMPRFAKGGAEHYSFWFTAIAEAKSNPGEIKDHALRFLGMYNIVGVLLFTIGFQYIQQITKLEDNIYDTVIFSMMLLLIHHHGRWGAVSFHHRDQRCQRGFRGEFPGVYPDAGDRGGDAMHCTKVVSCLC